MRPYEGIRIVDLTQILAGPYCTYQLGLLGAEIIKIEMPGQGDWVRVTGVDPALAKAGMGTHFLAQNAGKKSVTVNMKDERGLGIIKKLIATADVFVENFRPGAAKRLGLAYEDVKAIKPDIVYCSLSAYGQDGPISHRKGYDHVLQGTTGVMSLTGTPETGPTKAGLPFIDYATGLNGAFAVSAALFERQKTGKSQRVDIAMLDSTLLMMSNIITDYMITGFVPELFGNEAQSRSPTAGLFDAKDRPILIAANAQVQFRALMKALGQEEVPDDPRFSTHHARIENKAALREIVNDALKARTGEEWEALLESVDVPAGLIRNIAEVMAEDGQAVARGISQRMTLPGHDREIGVPTVGFKANGEVVAADTPPPELGADTDGVLAEIGYSEGDIAELRGAGVI
jgi:crotonobetainyl-CoA:carnitine CoA-transferase CaiB-like acyl-CoA transferase